MQRSASSIGYWVLALLVCLVVVFIATQISRQMTFWAIVASVLLLIWFWLQLGHAKPPE